MKTMKNAAADLSSVSNLVEKQKPPPTSKSEFKMNFMDNELYNILFGVQN